MAKRRSRRKMHDFQHPKITGDIPVFFCEEPDGAVTFEVDLTAAALSPRLPFCKRGDAIQSLVNEAQAYIDTYFTVVWTKRILVHTKQILGENGLVGVEFASLVVETADWPGTMLEVWRNADEPWETRASIVPPGWDIANCTNLDWTPANESAIAVLRAKVASFSDDIAKALAS